MLINVLIAGGFLKLYTRAIHQTCGDDGDRASVSCSLTSSNVVLVFVAEQLRRLSKPVTLQPFKSSHHLLPFSIMYLQGLLFLAALAVLGSAQNTSIPAVPEPPAPGLTFLYTSYAECNNSLYTSQGPRGIRQAIPIVGGNFTGPRLRGLTIPFLPSKAEPYRKPQDRSTTESKILTISKTRRDPQSRRRLGRDRPADGHLQRRHEIQPAHARRRQYPAADFWTCAAWRRFTASCCDGDW